MEIEDENWSINRKLKGDVMMIDSDDDDDDDDDDSGEGLYSFMSFIAYNDRFNEERSGGHGRKAKNATDYQ